MPEAHPQPNPADIKSLYRLMMDISFSPDGRENKTLQWFEHAYAINSTLCDPPTNLNRLYKALIAESGVMRKHAKKAFERVLAIGLLKHPHETEHRLETLWHYLSEPRKESRLQHIAKALLRVEHKPELDFEVEDPRFNCILNALCFLDETKNARNFHRYLNDFHKGIKAQGPTHDVISAIDYLKRTTPSSFGRLGALYTASFDYDNINIDLNTPEKRQLAKALFPTKEALFKHALAGVTNHITRALDLYTDIKNGVPDIIRIEDVNRTFALFNEASKDIDIGFVNARIHDIFTRFNTVNTSSKEIFSARTEIIELLTACAKNLEGAGILWRQLLIGAVNGMDVNTCMSSFNNYIYHCANALMDFNYRPIKRIAGFMLLSEFSEDKLVDAFKEQPKVLTEMYKMNNSQTLLKHIPSALRRECIGHDLGI